MDQQFVVIFFSFVHYCCCLGRLGEAVLLLLLVAISVRFATVVIDGANEQKIKEENNCTICLYPRFCYFHCFMLCFFSLLYPCLLPCCFSFSIEAQYDTIFVLLSIMVVAILQKKITWINYVLIDRLEVFLLSFDLNVRVDWSPCSIQLYRAKKISNKVICAMEKLVNH